MLIACYCIVKVVNKSLQKVSAKQLTGMWNYKMVNELQNKIKDLGRAFKDVEKFKGIEINLFLLDGTKVTYNSRDDEE